MERLVLVLLAFLFAPTGAQFIPGVSDYLGWGMDARQPTSELFYLMKRQLFHYTTENATLYRYPLDFSGYVVPDQAMVRTIAQTTTESYSFNSTRAELLALNLRLGLKLSNAQMNLTLSLQLDLVQESNQFQSIVYNLVETSLWQIYLNKDNRQLLADVREAAEDATLVPYSVDPAPYVAFLERYGTHYIDSVVVGGKITEKSIINYRDENERLQLSVGLGLRFQQASGTKIDLDLDFRLNSVSQSLQTSTVSDSEIFGGDPSFSDFVMTKGDYQRSKELFETWKASLPSNPMCIRYRVKEIYTLVEDKTARKELCTAMGTELGFLPDEEPDYCSNLEGSFATGTIGSSAF